MSRNDQLNWLWMESTALFPSIYMGPVLRSTKHGRLFVRNRVKEAIRVASVGKGVTRPVFVYTRPTYIGQTTPLSEMDLISTIGESVALGAAGVIFWGDTSYASSPSSCSNLNEYLMGSLGSYLLNVSTAAEVCSESLCKSRGRCLRKRPDQDVYLHLDSSSHSIISLSGQLKFVVEDRRSHDGGHHCHFSVTVTRLSFNTIIYPRSLAMNFLRNRLVVLGLVLLATLLLYLLLPAIRQGSMEPSLDAQKTSATSPPLVASVNVSIRTGQLPGDPPLFFREALPVDAAGRQMLPRLQIVMLHGQAFTSKTWEELGTMSILATHGYQTLAVDLPGYGKSPDSESLKTDQSRVDLLSRFMESLGIRYAVLVSPSMSGHYSIPFLMKNSAKLQAFIPIAPVGTRSYTPQQYQNVQTPTLIVFGALDTNLGAQSHKNLLQLPHASVLKLEGARHACYMDKPKEFHHGLINFLRNV
uniref:hyaluronoglucosaminidase n=1 Tax=Knipowitschia caucasica TaxID=637954 RepID=A0AAV2M7L2_KNICA